jgi:multiple sugar transport system permease protein
MQKQKKLVGYETKTGRWGYFFIAPFVVAFGLFQLWPTMNTFMLAFSNMKGLRNDFVFIGFANFAKLINDAAFWGALANTFIIWSINFIPQLGLALIFAIWLSDVQLNLAGKGLFRAII